MMLHRAIDNSRKVLAGIAAMVAILVLTIGCDKERMCRVPTGNATCQIDPNSALYPGLNNCDGYEYLVGGYNGIVVIRTSWNDFVAYERSCPLDSAILDVPDGYGNMVLECPRCGSRFSTFIDGTPLEGSRTSCMLYEYNTYYDGRTLYISNY